MAKGFKTGGKNFLPGQTGNANGRPPTPTELTECRAAASASALKDLFLFSSKTANELRVIASSNNSTSLQIAIAKSYERASQGSLQHLRFLLERILGPVPKAVAIGVGVVEPALSELPQNIDTDRLLEIVMRLQELPPDEPFDIKSVGTPNR